MALTLETLYKDHDNLRRILFLAESLLIDLCRGTSCDYPLLQRLLAYIQDYPERVHHPVEDAMLTTIFSNDVGGEKFRKDSSALIKDHTAIEKITREAVQAVESLLVEPEQDSARIAGILSTLISRQRSHILFEEVNIYPYISKHLDGEEWKRIAATVPDLDDPVFGDRVRAEYEMLVSAL